MHKLGQISTEKLFICRAICAEKNMRVCIYGYADIYGKEYVCKKIAIMYVDMLITAELFAQ